MFDWLTGKSQSAALPTLSAQEAWERMKSAKASASPVLIDVRETWEFRRGHARKARNIPLGELPQRLSEIPRDRDVLLICQSGNRSAVAARALARAGYTQVFNISGGTTLWRLHQLPME